MLFRKHKVFLGEKLVKYQLVFYEPGIYLMLCRVKMDCPEARKGRLVIKTVAANLLLACHR